MQLVCGLSRNEGAPQVSESHRMAALDDVSGLFARLSASGPVVSDMKQQAAAMVRALAAVRDAHDRFARRGHAGDVALVRARLQRQLVLAEELTAAYAAVEDGLESIRNTLMGQAQVLNALDTARLARDGQRQAAATDALARAARRDSEIMKRDSATMKTITVVTLVYLPATFVSTLLSMGIFDFGVGGGGGRLRIAREGWVFLAISLPLTLITLSLAFLWTQGKEREWKREGEALPGHGTSQDEGSGSEYGVGERASDGGQGPPGIAAMQTRRSYKDRLGAIVRLSRRGTPRRDRDLGHAKV